MNNQELSPAQELSPGTLWLMTIGAGVIVANIYYSQPLLGKIARDFNVSEATVSGISTLTQIGYACGLLLIVPLGDMMRRKKLIMLDFILILASLFGAALAPSIPVLMICSFFIGLSSVVPQLFVPMAAHLARPEQRGKAIGTVMSGLLIGILCSRTLSGLIGEHFGWRAVFFIATGLMILFWGLLALMLPEVHPDFKGSYRELIRSLGYYVRIAPPLRVAAIRGGLGFAGFSAFWTTLAFLLEKPPFHAGSDIAGAFGLIGASGALAASIVGRISDRFNKNTLVLMAVSLMILSWTVFGLFSASYAGLILGVLLLDMGLQGMHITNQTIIFSLYPQARNRLNTIYMVTYFIGGASGTYLAAQAWRIWQWQGVVAIGIISVFLILLLQLTAMKSRTKTEAGPIIE